MVILVTGAAGFIGSHTTERLLTLGHTVIGVDNFSDFYSPDFKEANIAGFIDNKKFTMHRVDIRDAEALHNAAAGQPIDAIIHLAAQAGIPYSIAHPVDTIEVNDVGTVQVFELARQLHIPKVVYASSSSVYGDTDEVPSREEANVDHPISLYAASKKSNELIAHVYHHLHGINMVGLRFFTVYGERGRPDMAPYKFTDMIMHEKELTRYGDGTMERDFTYVGDIVNGIVAALDAPLKYEIINLGHSQPVTLLHFISELERIIDKTARIVELPVPESDVRKTAADVSKAKQLLHWEPTTDLTTGLTRFVDWFKRERYNAII